MRKLRIRCKGRCRGNGKLYTLLEVPVEDGEQVIADSFFVMELVIQIDLSI